MGVLSKPEAISKLEAYKKKDLTSEGEGLKTLNIQAPNWYFPWYNRKS